MLFFLVCFFVCLFCCFFFIDRINFYAPKFVGLAQCVQNVVTRFRLLELVTKILLCILFGWQLYEVFWQGLK
jgi:hypothetical protein